MGRRSLVYRSAGAIDQDSKLDPRGLAQPDAVRDSLLHLASEDCSVVTEVHEVGAIACESIVDTIIDDVAVRARSEEHTSELQSRENLVCRLLLEKKKKKKKVKSKETIKKRK